MPADPKLISRELGTPSVAALDHPTGASLHTLARDQISPAQPASASGQAFDTRRRHHVKFRCKTIGLPALVYHGKYARAIVRLDRNFPRRRRARDSHRAEAYRFTAWSKWTVADKCLSNQTHASRNTYHVIDAKYCNLIPELREA